MAREREIFSFIWTYVSHTNSGELSGVERLGRELGVADVFVFFPLLSGMMYNRPEENLSTAERASIQHQFRGHPHLTLEFLTEESMCTGGGMSHVAVQPTGDVTFCPPVPFSYGNIKTERLVDLVRKVRKDWRRFCLDGKCRGQCPVNFPEYRETCHAKFLYG
jgi:hypothetical protein